MAGTLRDCRGGVVPPVATPLTEAGDVDQESLTSLCRRLIVAGVSGIFALGTTGECMYLSRIQQLEVLDTVVAGAGETVPVLVGVVEPTARRVVEQARPLLERPVAALVVTGPFYAQASADEMYRHFAYIAEHCDVPIVAYNIPANTGYALPAGVTARLLADSVISGIKDSSPDLAGLRAVIASASRSDAAYFTGSDSLFDCALQVGANGAVAGLSNIAPELFVQGMAAHLAGDATMVRELQERIGILTSIYCAFAPSHGVNSTQLGSIKTALSLQRVIATDQVSPPMTRSTPGRSRRIRQVLNDAGVLTVS